MTRAPNQPEMIRKGIRIVQGRSLNGGNAAILPGSKATSPFVDVLPPFTIARAYFAAIDVPTTVSVAAGEHGVFCLRSIRPGRDYADEFSFVGGNATLLPTDSDGGALTGYTNPLAWGDTRGTGACIVIGRNLGLPLQQWASRPVYVPGMDAGEASPGKTTLLNPASMPEYLAVLTFPTGKFRDTAPNKPPLSRNFAPHVHRFTRADTLDVALCVRRSVVNAIGATGSLVGFAEIALTLGLNIQPTAFQGQR